MASSVIDWIERYVGGLTFCDIGGIGLNSLNERASLAAHAGAASVTMIDYRRFGFPEWDDFDNKMAQAGLDDIKKIDGANLEDRGFPDQVGRYDFVHCTGILYHAPSPMLMLDNLARVTGRYLITNTVVVPEVIENAAGRLTFPGSQALFLPGISEDERAVLDLHYQETLNWPQGRFNAFAPRIGDESAAMPWMQTRAASEKHFWGDRGDLSYSPYWWLFTKPAFRAAIELLGFRILEEASFKGHTLIVFCERIEGPSGQSSQLTQQRAVEPTATTPLSTELASSEHLMSCPRCGAATLADAFDFHATWHDRNPLI